MLGYLPADSICSERIPIIRYPHDLHVNYARFHGLLRNVSFSFQIARAITPLIIYVKKLLDFVWLRTVQFFLNTVQKRGN